jgi:hypothetical protein
MKSRYFLLFTRGVGHRGACPGVGDERSLRILAVTAPSGSAFAGSSRKTIESAPFAESRGR